MSKTPHNVLKKIEEAKRNNSTTLNFEYSELTTVPKTIGKLTNLTRLFLHDNQLTTVPEAIGKLTNLTELRLDGNQLDHTPGIYRKTD